MSSPLPPPGQDPNRPEPTPTPLSSGFQTPPQSGPMYGSPAYPPPTASTNGLAIASLVCALVGIGTLVTAPIGAILGHIARRRIRESGEQGDGMALAGIIIGWSITGLTLGCCVLSITLGILGEAASAAVAVPSP